MLYTNNRYGAIPRKDWGGTLTGASSGFQMGSSIGMLFGPVGAGIAGGVGAITGALFGNASENKKAREQKKLAKEMEIANATAKAETDRLYKKSIRANDLNQLSNTTMNNNNSLFMSKGGWIGKASRSIKRRGTEGKCTPMSKPGCTGRALALAKTFHKMARNKAEGGPIDENNINIRDNRVTDVLTGKPLNDKNRFHAKVDRNYVQKVISYAKEHGVDPSTALAINMAETGFKDYYKSNPMMLHFSDMLGTESSKLNSANRDLLSYYKGYTGEDVTHVNDRGDVSIRNKSGYSAENYPEIKDNKYLKRVKEQVNAIDTVINNPVKSSISFMKTKFDNAKRLGKTTDEDIIQSYNGYGTIKNRGKMYGINTDSTAINMNTNPVYGKRVVNLRDSVIRKNSDILNIIKNTKANGGKVATKGISLGDGNKLITNSSGGTSGTHESGQNIPLVKNGKTVAVAEPGEVLVNDKDISKVPFVLSKKLGYAQEFMRLEKMKNSHNNNTIEDMQNKIVMMNNKVAGKGVKATTGINLGISPVSTSNIGLFKKNTGIQKYNGASPIKKNSSFNLGETLKGLDTNTIAGAAGTIGNLLMSNKTLKYQKGLINNSLNEALSYTPKLSKNYLLDTNIDVNDQVSGINQSYNSSIAGLEGIDPAIASALKNNASMGRNRSLSGVYGERNRIQTGIKNQNTVNIMSNNASNDNLLNQTSLMKLNAKISANEQLGEASNANLANTQGAISEFNSILRDRDMMDSLKSRWKDSIGDTFIKAPKFDSETGLPYKKYGGRISKKRKYSLSY